MDTDKVFDHVSKDQNLSACNVEEELHIAATLGRELLLQNDAIKKENRMLWEVSEEHGREIEMLRQQNKLLREEAESKSNDQIELEKKATEMESQKKLSEKDMSDLQALLSSMRKSAHETEKLYIEESRRADTLAKRVNELERELDDSALPQTLSPLSPRRESKLSFNEIHNDLSRSEEKRRCLEEDIKLLLEENCELYNKVKVLEDYHNDHNCKLDNSRRSICQITELDDSTLNSTQDADSLCSTIESFTSESWLAEKLAALEDRYNSACDNCICGACESIMSQYQDGDDLTKLSYRELFDQLFEALRSTQIRTPRGTLNRKQTSTPKKPHVSTVFDHVTTQREHVTTPVKEGQK